MEQKKMQMPRLKIKPGVLISIIIVIILSVVLFFQDRINKVVDSTNETDVVSNQQSIELPIPQEYILKKLPDASPKLVDTSRAKPDIEMKTVEETPTTTAVEQKQADAMANVQIQGEIETADKPTSTSSKVEKSATPQPPEESSSPTVTENKAVAQLENMLKRHQINGKSWILQQAPASFTAQLIGSSRPDTLYSLAKNATMQENAAIYHVLRKNKDWYVLIYGSYPDKETIRKAVDKLPASLRKGGPWVRSMDAVQAEIKAGKK
jgi:septal ring-binding cell division protein DamX